MKEFKLLLLISIFCLSFVMSGCNSSEKTSMKGIDTCPTCNMQIDTSRVHSTSLHVNKGVHYFDDIGCMILFCKENQIDLKQTDSKVFTKDTQKYLDSFAAHYKSYENTPMGYGFTAYDKQEENSINFDEVIVNMLRGEHMANPKIRKHILGNKDAQ